MVPSLSLTARMALHVLPTLALRLRKCTPKDRAPSILTPGRKVGVGSWSFTWLLHIVRYSPLHYRGHRNTASNSSFACCTRLPLQRRHFCRVVILYQMDADCAQSQAPGITAENNGPQYIPKCFLVRWPAVQCTSGYFSRALYLYFIFKTVIKRNKWMVLRVDCKHTQLQIICRYYIIATI